jgi:hypothetical protein
MIEAPGYEERPVQRLAPSLGSEGSMKPAQADWGALLLGLRVLFSAVSPTEESSSENS